MRCGGDWLDGDGMVDSHFLSPTCKCRVSRGMCVYLQDLQDVEKIEDDSDSVEETWSRGDV